MLDWGVIRDQATAQAFADKLVAAPRSFWGRTAISAGVDRAVQLQAESGFEAPRHVIDVCGDGTNNAGRDVTEARDDALKAGITINGLAIINDHPVSWTYAHVQPPGGLPNYYRENVTGGPRQLCAGGARFPHIRRGDDPQAGHRDRRRRRTTQTGRRPLKRRGAGSNAGAE